MNIVHLEGYIKALEDIQNREALGVKGFDLSKNVFKMYPNPSYDSINIEAKETIKSVTVYSVSGRLIQQISYIGNSNRVEVSTKNLTQGTYFVEVSSASGHGYKKLVKN